MQSEALHTLNHPKNHRLALQSTLRVRKPLRKTVPKTQAPHLHHHLLHAPPVCSAPMKELDPMHHSHTHQVIV